MALLRAHFFLSAVRVRDKPLRALGRDAVFESFITLIAFTNSLAFRRCYLLFDQIQICCRFHLMIPAGSVRSE